MIAVVKKKCRPSGALKKGREYQGLTPPVRPAVPATGGRPSGAGERVPLAGLQGRQPMRVRAGVEGARGAGDPRLPSGALKESPRHKRNKDYSEDVARNPDPLLHEALIRKHVGKLMYQYKVSMEEARHEIMVQWWKWAQRYDPKRVRWSTYFHSHVLRQAREELMRTAGWERRTAYVPREDGKKSRLYKTVRVAPSATMGGWDREWAGQSWGRGEREDVVESGGCRMERAEALVEMRQKLERAYARAQVTVVERKVLELRAQGMTLWMVAEVLEGEGHVGPRGNALTRERVRQIQNAVMARLGGDMTQGQAGRMNSWESVEAGRGARERFEEKRRSVHRRGAEGAESEREKSGERV